MMWHKVWALAKQEYIAFLFSKKTLLMLFSFIFLAESVVGKMCELATQTGMELGKLEPFLLIMSYEQHAMVIPIMFIVLLSDFPANKSSGIFIMGRTSRLIWLTGEMLYALMAGLTYILFLFVGTILWMGKTGSFLFQWSDYMTTLYTAYPEEYMLNDHLFIRAGTVTQGTPLSVLVQSVLLMLLYLLLIASLLAVFKLTEKKQLGLFATIALTGLGAVAVAYFGEKRWFFPMAHAIFGTHFNEFFAKPECALWVSYVFFIITIGVLFAINGMLAKKIRIGDEAE